MIVYMMDIGYCIENNNFWLFYPLLFDTLHVSVKELTLSSKQSQHQLTTITTLEQLP